ncbi:hypothetical protein Q4Q35_10920 [Flavivirga aquimarina]|uniref:Uncharacterized protein n=1 Tax=Flavivirga aquimarina TaxID=2027862 RepID=A0ABT8WBB4_9FLAO|nr:hypothetical protein [Flavivirga aquimarina]MDO5970317.1 hypothetical protein [Flavivirga aquimarina]
MPNNLYYGEIAAYISGKLVENPDHKTRINHVIAMQPEKETIPIISAEAARVFDRLEDLSSDYFIDWHKAVSVYSEQILDCLLSGKMPTLIDMVSMTASSIQNSQ